MREAARAGANSAAASVGGAGVTGLKSLGVRDLQYKTAFLACMVHNADGRVRRKFYYWLSAVDSLFRRALISVARKKKEKTTVRLLLDP